MRNLLVVHDKKLAEWYSENWSEHEKHSEDTADELMRDKDLESGMGLLHN